MTTAAAPDGHARGAALAEAALAGDRRALARLLTAVESRTPTAESAIRILHPRAGGAHVIGITGAPGSGKSTLVNALLRELRARGRSVAVIAVDPSSPITGGAILGDRVRMQEHATDDGVFIRSMAARGHAGGLAATTDAAVAVLDAAGFDVVIVETVGTGQSEVEVVATTDTTVVLEAPGMGDEIQAIKAGIMEVADLFVINKADRDGADQVERELEGMKSLAMARDWDPPVLRTVAQQGAGVAELLAQVREHGHWLRGHGGLARKARERARLRFESLLAEASVRRAKALAGPARLEAALQGIADRTLDPYTAVDEILSQA